MTIFDYDHTFLDRMLVCMQNYLPIKVTAGHSCCPPVVVSRVVFPVVLAFIDTWLLCRTLIHNVPESEIVSALEEFGIQREMLPTIMGGTVELNPSEWIAQRRAAEMAELS